MVGVCSNGCDVPAAWLWVGAEYLALIHESRLPVHQCRLIICLFRGGNGQGRVETQAVAKCPCVLIIRGRLQSNLGEHTHLLTDMSMPHTHPAYIQIALIDAVTKISV